MRGHKAIADSETRVDGTTKLAENTKIRDECEMRQKEKIIENFLFELIECTPEQLDRFEPILLAKSIKRGDNLAKFIEVAFALVRSKKPKAICMKEV